MTMQRRYLQNIIASLGSALKTLFENANIIAAINIWSNTCARLIATQGKITNIF